VETVRILIAAGADVHVRDQNDAPLLHLAVSDEGVPIMEMLLEAGLYVDSVNRYGTTPLMWAAHGGNTRATVFLLSKGANVNWQNLSGITPLLDAARQGRARDAEVLLAHGANKDWAIPGDGMTALMLAAYRGDVDTVNVLLRAGVDVNAKRFDGSTALTKALEECHTEIADLLRAAGAKE
jgi:ankyrin repeat protein